MTTQLPVPLARHPSDASGPHGGLAGVRTETAIVRTLTDALDRLGLDESEPLLEQQLIEALTRLGCRAIETAAELARACRPEPCEDSGVYAIRPGGEPVTGSR